MSLLSLSLKVWPKADGLDSYSALWAELFAMAIAGSFSFCLCGDYKTPQCSKKGKKMTGKICCCRHKHKHPHNSAFSSKQLSSNVQAAAQHPLSLSPSQDCLVFAPGTATCDSASYLKYQVH